MWNNLFLRIQTLRTLANCHRHTTGTHPSVTPILSPDYSLRNVFFQPVSAAYIGTLCDKIKNNESCGQEKKLCHTMHWSQLRSCLINFTRIFNQFVFFKQFKVLAWAFTVTAQAKQSYWATTWPAEWKVSNIAPVLKQDFVSSVSCTDRLASSLPYHALISVKVMFDKLYEDFQPICFLQTIQGSCVSIHGDCSS